MRPSPAPVLSPADAHALARRIQVRGGTVVFTNGVFDLIHPGHVRYLQEARRLGDALIVAINTDRSVRGNKGEARPIIPEAERAELLCSLACVDAVVLFGEATPHAVISAIGPDGGHVFPEGFA